MSLEELLREIDRTRKGEQERMLAAVREQYEARLKEKDEEIASLKEEIETLRTWLDHSALPAANPISKRLDSMGLIKMNFGKDKPCPPIWAPGEKDMLASIGRETLEWRGHSIGSRLPEPPKPSQKGSSGRARKPRGRKKSMKK